MTTMETLCESKGQVVDAMVKLTTGEIERLVIDHIETVGIGGEE